MQPYSSILIPHGPSRLAGRLYIPQKPSAGVVIAHGLDSSMQSSKLNSLAKGLMDTGLAALLFDHAGCGDSPGSQRDTTLSTRRDEFLHAAAELQRRLGHKPIMYAGSSMGGAAALLAAHEKAPAALAAWVAPIDLDDCWTRITNGPLPPDMPGMAADRSRHDMKKVLASISRVLFIYAENDDVVPPEPNAQLAYDLTQEPKELWVAPGADHVFSDPATRAEVIERTVKWFNGFTSST